MSEVIKALVNSKKYQDARERLGERERVGDMNQLREEADTWAPTRKAANRHLLDDEPIYVNGKIGGGMIYQDLCPYGDGEWVARQ